MAERLDWQTVRAALAAAPPGRMYALPSRGAIAAGLLAGDITPAARPEDADWILADPADAVSAGLDTGSRLWWPFAADALFPWEAGAAEERLAALGRDLLRTLGTDITGEGVRDTPQRWARWWQEFLDYAPQRTDAAFTLATSDHLVSVSGIRTWSVCEHHLLPFMIDATVGYIPAGKVLGLSKFARIVERSARRLQLQERIGEEIAGTVAGVTSSRDVAVVIRGRHLCMEARGARVGAISTSMATRGRFRVEAALRAEMLALAGAAGAGDWLNEDADQPRTRSS